jgi:uncharacterized protein
MAKLFVVLLVVGVGLWALLARVRAARRGENPPPRVPSQAALAPREDMVRCAHCGVHLPGSDAVRSGERLYCSAEHAAAGPRHG